MPVYFHFTNLQTYSSHVLNDSEVLLVLQVKTTHLKQMK